MFTKIQQIKVVFVQSRPWIRQLTRGKPCSILSIKSLFRKTQLAKREDPFYHRISWSGFWVQTWIENGRYNANSSYFFVIETYWSFVSILRYFALPVWQALPVYHWQRVESKYWKYGDELIIRNQIFIDPFLLLTCRIWNNHEFSI